MENLLEEQPRVLREFQKIIQSNMLSHAYLIDSASSKIRQQVAIWLAQSQFCENLQDGMPDQTCQKCQTIALGDNPDVLEIRTDKNSIGVDDIKYFKKEASMTATQGSRRILIIDEAEKMTNAASNNLLKTIEEPEGNLMMILLADSAKQLLQTIRSRVQTFHLSNKSNEEEIASLAELGYKDEQAKAALKVSDIKFLQATTGEDYQKLSSALVVWMKECNQKKINSFIDVQTDIMPLVENKDHQHLVFDMMNQMFSDILSIRYNLDKSLLIKEDVLSNKSIQQIVSFSDELFKAEEMWKSNVAFQAILEDLSLKFVS
ncbi:DNA polymerase III subunit delta' [Companilactobacillus nodensis]|uniref:DNA polymerase III subunit delta n=1 Tax=Companilactobacillus nodensis DSM 19682 = JCM 14932 = NBRC 107160 TaxID=1423775 RepID=A0A0R1KID9_9LACO|nr:DNA polymerase III subunit delta' [Companilactobacillus nodensis]KRK79810.1 DNA polymerase III subunit delta [Companilactobacillus nodensis DSM 19682 = JCM 14932 = NBRC 107160]